MKYYFINFGYIRNGRTISKLFGTYIKMLKFDGVFDLKISLPKVNCLQFLTLCGLTLIQIIRLLGLHSR